MQKVSIVDLIGTAQMLTASGRATLAASLYRDWTQRNPDDPLLHAVWFNFGVLLSDLGDLAGAAQAFGEAIQRNPGFLPAFVNLGSVHEKLGAPELALAHWSHVTASLAGVTGETVTYKATALKQTAQLLESRKLLAEAEDALRQIIELTPQQRDVVQHWISLRQRQCCWPLLAPVGSLDRR
jgi:predicted O-linked N-acetylglucosamine transferase (SPINDLY family)